MRVRARDVEKKERKKRGIEKDVVAFIVKIKLRRIAYTRYQTAKKQSNQWVI